MRMRVETTISTLLLTLILVAASTIAPVMGSVISYNDVTPSVAPGATPSVTPGATPSVTPGATPSVTPGACGPIDLAVILDVTGSMGGAISNVITEVPTIISTADTASAGDLNLGLVTFRDTVNVTEPLTPKSAGGETFFTTNLTAQFASGGGDAAEPSDEAKNTVINNLPGGVRADVEGFIADGFFTPIGDFTNPWRPTALKLVVIITDAPSNGFSENATGSHVPLGDTTYAANLASLGTAAAAKGIKVFDVFVPDGGDYAGQLENLTVDAVNSGGAILVTAPDGTGTGAAIEKIIATCGAPTAKGSISGMKFNDLNHNGMKDTGEPGLANWTITLKNQTGGMITTMTDASGNYSFTNLTNGNYTVGEVIQPGWIQTAPAVSTTGSATYKVKISGGNNVGNQDFGNFFDIPKAACVETVNPAGKNVPPAGTTLPGTKGGQNPDGFYQLLATDIFDPSPQIFVKDMGSGTIFPLSPPGFVNGTNIKYTQAPGATPSIKPIGGPNSAVSWHITGTGDAAVFAVNFLGNPSPSVSCLVPPPPK